MLSQTTVFLAQVDGEIKEDTTPLLMSRCTVYETD